MDPAVFGYIRVSLAEWERGLATPRQVPNARWLREARIFTDVVSGRNPRRPEWKALHC